MGRRTSTKIKLTKKAWSSPMKGVRLPVYSRRERLWRTDALGSSVRTLVGAKGAKVDLTRSPFIKKHDPKRILRKMVKLGLVDLSRPKVASKIDDWYRAAWGAQDEFVRTSFVRDMLTKIAPGDLTAAVQKPFADALQSISAYRFPTRWSGFHFTDGTEIAGFSVMQHPTSATGGIWLTKLTGSGTAHNHLDEARLAEVLDAVLAKHFDYDAMSKTWVPKVGALLQDIVSTLIVSAGTFTFRNFTLPATASNMTTEKVVSAAEKLKQLKAREFMKDQLVAQGAVRSTKVRATVPPLKLNAIDRPAAPELLNPGEVSPRRGPIVTFAEIEPLML